MVVQEPQGGTDSGLVMALRIAVHRPTFDHSLGQQEFRFRRGEQDTRAGRILERDGQERTHHAGRIVALVVTGGGILLYQARQGRNVVVGRDRRPVVVPRFARIVRLRARTALLFPGIDLVGDVETPLRSRFDARRVDVVAADAVQTRVARLLHTVVERRTDEGRGGRVLSVEHFAQRIGPEIELLRTVVERERSRRVDHIGIFGRRADIAAFGTHRLFELLLGLGRLDVGDSHRETHAQGIGVFLPCLGVAAQARNVAADVVVARAELRHAFGKFREEIVVDLFLRVVFRRRDSGQIALSCLGARHIAVGIGQHRQQIDLMNPQRGVEVRFVVGTFDRIRQILDRNGVVAVP